MSRSLLWYLASDWFPLMATLHAQFTEQRDPIRHPSHVKSVVEMDEVDLNTVRFEQYLPLLGDCPHPEHIGWSTKTAYQFDRTRFRPINPRELESDPYLVRNLTPDIDTTFACENLSMFWNFNDQNGRNAMMRRRSAMMDPRNMPKTATFGHRRDGGPCSIYIYDMVRRHRDGRLDGSNAVSVKKAVFSWSSENNTFKDRGAAGPGEITLNNVRLGFQNGMPVESSIGSMEVNWTINDKRFVINQQQNDFRTIEQNRGIRLNLLDDRTIFPNPTEQVIFASDVLA